MENDDKKDIQINEEKKIQEKSEENNNEIQERELKDDCQIEVQKEEIKQDHIQQMKVIQNEDEQNQEGIQKVTINEEEKQITINDYQIKKDQLHDIYVQKISQNEKLQRVLDELSNKERTLSEFENTFYKYIDTFEKFLKFSDYNLTINIYYQGYGYMVTCFNSFCRHIKSVSEQMFMDFSRIFLTSNGCYKIKDAELFPEESIIKQLSQYLFDVLDCDELIYINASKCKSMVSSFKWLIEIVVNLSIFEKIIEALENNISIIIEQKIKITYNVVQSLLYLDFKQSKCQQIAFRFIKLIKKDLSEPINKKEYKNYVVEFLKLSKFIDFQLLPQLIGEAFNVTEDKEIATHLATFLEENDIESYFNQDTLLLSKYVSQDNIAECDKYLLESLTETLLYKEKSENDELVSPSSKVVFQYIWNIKTQKVFNYIETVLQLPQRLYTIADLFGDYPSQSIDCLFSLIKILYVNNKITIEHIDLIPLIMKEQNNQDLFNQRDTIISISNSSCLLFKKIVTIITDKDFTLVFNKFMDEVTLNTKIMNLNIQKILNILLENLEKFQQKDKLICFLIQQIFKKVDYQKEENLTFSKEIKWKELLKKCIKDPSCASELNKVIKFCIWCIKTNTAIYSAIDLLYTLFNEISENLQSNNSNYEIYYILDNEIFNSIYSLINYVNNKYNLLDLLITSIFNLKKELLTFSSNHTISAYTQEQLSQLFIKENKFELQLYIDLFIKDIYENSQKVKQTFYSEDKSISLSFDSFLKAEIDEHKNTYLKLTVYILKLIKYLILPNDYLKLSKEYQTNIKLLQSNLELLYVIFIETYIVPEEPKIFFSLFTDLFQKQYQFSLNLFSNETLKYIFFDLIPKICPNITNPNESEYKFIHNYFVLINSKYKTISFRQHDFSIISIKSFNEIIGFDILYNIAIRSKNKDIQTKAKQTITQIIYFVLNDQNVVENILTKILLDIKRDVTSSKDIDILKEHFSLFLEIDGLKPPQLGSDVDSTAEYLSKRQAQMQDQQEFDDSYKQIFDSSLNEVKQFFPDENSEFLKFLLTQNKCDTQKVINDLLEEDIKASYMLQFEESQNKQLNVFEDEQSNEVKEDFNFKLGSEQIEILCNLFELKNKEIDSLILQHLSKIHMKKELINLFLNNNENGLQELLSKNKDNEVKIFTYFLIIKQIFLINNNQVKNNTFNKGQKELLLYYILKEGNFNFIIQILIEMFNKHIQNEYNSSTFLVGIISIILQLLQAIYKSIVILFQNNQELQDIIPTNQNTLNAINYNFDIKQYKLSIDLTDSFDLSVICESKCILFQNKLVIEQLITIFTLMNNSLSSPNKLDLVNINYFFIIGLIILSIDNDLLTFYIKNEVENKTMFNILANAKQNNTVKSKILAMIKSLIEIFNNEQITINDNKILIYDVMLENMVNMCLEEISQNGLMNINELTELIVFTLNLKLKQEQNIQQVPKSIESLIKVSVDRLSKLTTLINENTNQELKCYEELSDSLNLIIKIINFFPKETTDYIITRLQDNNVNTLLMLFQKILFNHTNPLFTTKIIDDLRIKCFQLFTILSKHNNQITKSLLTFMNECHPQLLSNTLALSSKDIPMKDSQSNVYKYTGIKNYGATCYINSLLQQLFIMPQFIKSLYNVDIPSTTPTEIKQSSIIYQLQLIFAQMQNSLKKYISLDSLFIALDLNQRSVDISKQEDVDEFLARLSDLLEEDAKKYGITTLLNSSFKGELKSEIKSIDENVKYSNITNENFIKIILDIQNKSELSEALDSFEAAEELEDGIEIAENSQKIKVSKRNFISNLSNNVIIQLNRFIRTKECFLRKSNDYIQIPRQINFSKWMQVENENKTDNEYILTGIIVHIGATLETGHYFSIIYDKEEKKWIKISDMDVKELSENELEIELYNDCYADDVQQMRSPYLLFYSKKENKENIEGENEYDYKKLIPDEMKKFVDLENEEFYKTKMYISNYYSEFLQNVIQNSIEFDKEEKEEQEKAKKENNDDEKKETEIKTETEKEKEEKKEDDNDNQNDFNILNNDDNDDDKKIVLDDKYEIFLTKEEINNISITKEIIKQLSLDESNLNTIIQNPSMKQSIIESYTKLIETSDNNINSQNTNPFLIKYSVLFNYFFSIAIHHNNNSFEKQFQQFLKNLFQTHIEFAYQFLLLLLQNKSELFIKHLIQSSSLSQRQNFSKLIYFVLSLIYTEEQQIIKQSDYNNVSTSSYITVTISSNDEGINNVSFKKHFKSMFLRFIKEAFEDNFYLLMTYYSQSKQFIQLLAEIFNQYKESVYSIKHLLYDVINLLGDNYVYTDNIFINNKEEISKLEIDLNLYPKTQVKERHDNEFEIMRLLSIIVTIYATKSMVDKGKKPFSFRGDDLNLLFPSVINSWIFKPDFFCNKLLNIHDYHTNNSQKLIDHPYQTLLTHLLFENENLSHTAIDIIYEIISRTEPIDMLIANPIQVYNILKNGLCIILCIDDSLKMQRIKSVFGCDDNAMIRNHESLLHFLNYKVNLSEKNDQYNYVALLCLDAIFTMFNKSKDIKRIIENNNSNTNWIDSFVIKLMEQSELQVLNLMNENENKKSKITIMDMIQHVKSMCHQINYNINSYYDDNY